MQSIQKVAVLDKETQADERAAMVHARDHNMLAETAVVRRDHRLGYDHRLGNSSVGAVALRRHEDILLQAAEAVPDCHDGPNCDESP